MTSALHRAAITAVSVVVFTGAMASAQVPTNPKIVISTGSNAVLGSVNVANEDLAQCALTSTGLLTTSCTWSLLFDGSAAGLTSSVKALEVLPNGSLIMAVGADNSIPDLSGIKRKDLALFVPVDPAIVPYTSGEWRLYMDGDAVKGSSDARVWDAITVLPDGDVLVSVSTAGTLGSLAHQNEDIIRCHPTAFSVGGAITACQYSMFLDSSAIQLTGGGPGGFIGNLFAFDVVGPAQHLIFRAGIAGSLPPHQAERDLLQYVGTFGTSPVGDHSFFFDGDTSAGLAGETMQAMAFVPDDDGDGVLDGLDNCPGVSNPGQEDADGDGIGDACDGDPDCNDPSQADADNDGVHDACDVCDACFDPTNTDPDGDGVCNPCDYCPFRADPTCRCGDGILDPPGEQCDLGDASNGQPGSPCSASCQVTGTCTQSGGPCEVASDCPISGEGCCGNALVEGDEACDDGNDVDDDQCTNGCVLNPSGIPVLGCEDLLGPSITAAFVKNAHFVDTPAFPGNDFDRWKTRGDFNLFTGTDIDPDSENVKLILVQGADPTSEYEPQLGPGSFVQKGTALNWKFLDAEADVPGALGWRFGKLVQRKSSNKVKYSQNGRSFGIVLDTTPPIRIRQTIRIGDVCATTVVECEQKGSGALKCRSPVLIP